MSEKETETSLFRVARFDALYPMRTSGTWEGLVREKPRGCRTVFLHLSLSLLWLANNAVAPFSSAEHKRWEVCGWSFVLPTRVLPQGKYQCFKGREGRIPGESGRDEAGRRLEWCKVHIHCLNI